MSTEKFNASKDLTPEYVDFTGLERIFGIKRSLGYLLLSDGRIKGLSLKQDGRTRGKRLFCVRSVRDYLLSEMEAQSSDPITEE
jgi:hypothetical protein